MRSFFLVVFVMCFCTIVGSCQIETSGPKRAYNAGNATKIIFFMDGILTMNYSGGDVCQQNSAHRSTIVNFVCAPAGVGHGSPRFDGERTHCSYFVSWHTELACTQSVRFRSTAITNCCEIFCINLK